MRQDLIVDVNPSFPVRGWPNFRFLSLFAQSSAPHFFFSSSSRGGGRSGKVRLIWCRTRRRSFFGCV